MREINEITNDLLINERNANFLPFAHLNDYDSLEWI